MEHYGRRIRVFKNGDPYFTGKKMLISPAYHRLYEQVLAKEGDSNGNGISNISIHCNIFTDLALARM